jgi:acyl-CoA thioesterase FadM
VPRTTTYDLLLDSSFFTPVQMQPLAIGRLGFNAGARWLKEHVCSHRDLVFRHQVGIVLWAWELHYVEPLGFHAADEAQVEVTARVRGPRTQLECRMTITGPGGVAVDMRAISVPLALSGDAALSGAPHALPDAIVERFEEDELEPVPYRSEIARTRSALRRDGRLLAEAAEPFRIHRHNCEVADQWFWAESLGFAAAGREELVARHAAEHPGLRRGLSAPVRRIDATHLKAYQFLDHGTVTTTAYEWDGGLVFLHDLSLADDGQDVHATAIERF